MTEAVRWLTKLRIGRTDKNRNLPLYGSRKRYTIARKLFVTLSCTLMVCTLLTPHALADNVSSTHSIVGDWFNKVFSVYLGDGHLVFDDEGSKKARIEANDDIYDTDNQTSNQYSLYDRFGGDINFVPYFGEIRITTGIFDEFYTKVVENDGKFELTLDDIKLFFQESSISNNVVYTNRPNIIGSEEVQAGYRDPRVSAYSGVNTTGGDAMMGNVGLNIAKFFVSFVSFFTGTRLFDTLNGAVETIYEFGVVDVLKQVVQFLWPLCIFTFLLVLISNTFKIIRGKESIKVLLSFLVSACVSFGVVGAFLNNPTGLNNTIHGAVTLVDDVLDSGIAESEDEIVKSDFTTNVREALLWRTAVFDPWCYGQFGDSYEHLYTMYADLSQYDDERSAMEQDNDQVDTVWDDGSARYNSVMYTGDPVVPIGNSQEIRNWAALAWSCQSIFHIDATELEYAREIPNTWPKAELTPKNNQIYVDNFRWLDAFLNISPEYRNVDDIRINYTNSNEYEQWFVAGGTKAVMMTLFMIPLMLLGFRKAIVSVKLIMNGFQLIGNGLLSFVLPQRYNVFLTVKRLLETFFDYIWWSLATFLAIFLYGKMVGDGLVGNVIFCVIGAWLFLVKPVRTTAQMNRILARMRKMKDGMKSRGKLALLSVRDKITQKFKK